MEMQSRSPLDSDNIPGLFLKYSLTSIATMVVNAVYNVIDQLFISYSIGYLGNAATTVAFPLTTITMAVSVLFGVGGSAKYNLLMGEGRREEAQKVLGNAIMLLLFFGFGISLVVFLFIEPLSWLFGATEATIELVIAYGRIFAVSMPFSIISMGCGHLVRADGAPRRTMIYLLAGVAINTILDPVFLFGFRTGIAGAAWATVIGFTISTILLVHYLFRMHSFRLGREDLRIKWRYCSGIMRLGLPNFVNQVTFTVVSVVSNNMLVFTGAASRFGSEIPLACAGIINQIRTIVNCVVGGLCQGLHPIVGYNYGARQFSRIRKTWWLALKTGFIVSAGVFLSFQLFPRQIMGLFGEGSEDFFRFAVLYFRIYSMGVLWGMVEPLTTNYLVAVGKVRVSISLILLRRFAFVIPTLLVFSHLWGISGYLWSRPAGELLVAVSAAFFMRRELKLLEEEG